MYRIVTKDLSLNSNTIQIEIKHSQFTPPVYVTRLSDL